MGHASTLSLHKRGQIKTPPTRSRKLFRI
uniref:Uncharacterized protein n=1 Tax=Heterorhabditis bacteriophora TaxID=37862 RepID=A0A1I7X059_HETBA